MKMRHPSARTWIAGFLLASVSSGAHAFPTIAPGSQGGGCLDVDVANTPPLYGGATMYARIVKVGVVPLVQEVYIYDYQDNATPTPNQVPDGLPEYIYCAGGSGGVWLNPATPSTNSTCTGLKTLSSTIGGCAFTFKVFMGSAGSDDNSSSYIDCSGVSDPILFFGGAGDDLFRGTVHGDFGNGGLGDDDFKGDDGPDYLCMSHAPFGNVADGEAGNDIVWGGPRPDTLGGGGNTDLVHGAVDNDSVDGGLDPDYVHGGDFSDEMIDGSGESADTIHTGKHDGFIGAETVEAVDGNDKVFANDDGPDDVNAGGEVDTDTCHHDANDTTVDCTNTTAMPICTTPHPFVVATRDGGGVVELHELRYDGPHGVGLPGYVTQRARVWNSTHGYFDKVVGMAVDPGDCDDLYAVVVEGASQYLVLIDVTTEPVYNATPGAVVYTATVKGTLASPLVDIAFDYEGNLGGLQPDADFVPVNKSNGSFGTAKLVGRSGTWTTTSFTDPVGYHMAFDDPDGGLFLTTTQDPNPDGYNTDEVLVALDAFHYPTGFSTNHEDHIPAVVSNEPFGTAPFTVTNADDVGTLFTLEPTEGGGSICGTGDYRFLKLQRRGFDLQVWDKWSCEDTECCAPLGEGMTIDAVTIPHYVLGEEEA